MTSWRALWLPCRSLEGAEPDAIVAWLRERRGRVLARRSVDQIIDVLDRVAVRWLDPLYPLRKKAIAQIARHTGFSPEMVEHAIVLEQVSSRGADIRAALDSELGCRGALDGWIDSPKGRRTAVGPEVVTGIFSANIPALPHLTVMRSFLVKAACLGRVSRGEPDYLPMYAESLREVDPELASCLAVGWWDPEDHETEARVLRASDHLIAYGSDASIAAIAHRNPQTRATWHGHRMGFAWIGRSALTAPLLDDLADRIAYDFSVFDQHACLAPQACYVEKGGAIGPHAFGHALADAMGRWAERLPPRRLGVDASARLRAEISRIDVAEALGRPVRRMTKPETLQGAVVLDERPGSLVPTPLERFVRIVPVDGPHEAEERLRPVRRYLQCAAVEGVDDAFRLMLARLGATRLCPAGAMGTPSMVWRHDGRACLNELVTWCDEETRPPGEGEGAVAPG